jgi:chitinase
MSYTKIISSFLLLVLVSAPIAPVHAGLLLSDKEQAKLDVKKRDGGEGQWLMAYYVGYQNSYLKPRDVDYSLMTHIVVGGVSVNANGTLDEHWHMENGDGEEMARDVGKRAKRAGVKTLVWLGGPNEEDKFLSASSDLYRATFVKNIVKLIEDLKYDGVDIDWEPIRKQDEASVLALVKDLRAAKPDLIITIPVNWVPTTIIMSKDLSIYKELSKYVDRLFIMSYSMAGPWPGWKVWHGGALKGDTLTTPGSIRSSVSAYLRAGVPEKMLGIGIGTYATCWEYPVKNPEQTVPATFYPTDIGTMSMRTLMDKYYVKKYEKWDAKAQVPYVSYKKAKGEWDCGFISYENEKSITAKVEYMKDEGLGGAIVWNIGTGYYPNKSSSKRHPLLKAAWEALQ